MIAIQTKYLGPTNHKGSRVKAFTHNGHQVTLTWDSALNSEPNHRQAADALCEKMNWIFKDLELVGGWLKDGDKDMVFVFTEK